MFLQVLPITHSVYVLTEYNDTLHFSENEGFEFQKPYEERFGVVTNLMVQTCCAERSHSLK